MIGVMIVGTHLDCLLRMQNKISSDGEARNLYIQVTSDSILTPQLKMLGADSFAEQRPVWGSTLVYELYQHKQDHHQHIVRYERNSKWLIPFQGTV